MPLPPQRRFYEIMTNCLENAGKMLLTLLTNCAKSRIQEAKNRKRQRGGEGRHINCVLELPLLTNVAYEQCLLMNMMKQHKKYAKRRENWTTNGAIRELREYANTMNLTRMRGDRARTSERDRDGERGEKGRGQSSLLAAFMSIKNWRRHICRIYTHNQTHSQSCSLALSLCPPFPLPPSLTLSLSAVCQQRLKAKQALRPKDINWQ